MRPLPESLVWTAQQLCAELCRAWTGDDTVAPESAPDDGETSAHDRGALAPFPAADARSMCSLVPVLTRGCASRLSAKVDEIMGMLKDEVKELSNTDWLYETNEPRIISRIHV